MKIEIRHYENADFAPITGLWRRSREIALPEFQREKGHPFEMDQWYFKEHILKENNVLIAELNGQRVGFMAMREDFIDQLFVDPDHWQMGIGSAFVDHARSIAPQHLWLYTLQVNYVARAFYRKQGFVARKFGLSPPPESEPDVEYHWPPQD